MKKRHTNTEKSIATHDYNDWPFSIYANDKWQMLMNNSFLQLVGCYNSMERQQIRHQFQITNVSSGFCPSFSVQFIIISFTAWMRLFTIFSIVRCDDAIIFLVSFYYSIWHGSHCALPALPFYLKGTETKRRKKTAQRTRE